MERPLKGFNHNDERRTTDNRRLAKWRVQCLNETLCPATAGFSTHRQFSTSKTRPNVNPENISHDITKPAVTTKK